MESIKVKVNCSRPLTLPVVLSDGTINMQDVEPQEIAVVEDSEFLDDLLNSSKLVLAESEPEPEKEND